MAYQLYGLHLQVIKSLLEHDESKFLIWAALSLNLVIKSAAVPGAWRVPGHDWCPTNPPPKLGYRGGRRRPGVPSALAPAAVSARARIDLWHGEVHVQFGYIRTGKH